MNEHISKIVNHPLRVPVVVGVVSFGVGVGVGYLIPRRRKGVLYEIPKPKNQKGWDEVKEIVSEEPVERPVRQRVVIDEKDYEANQEPDLDKEDENESEDEDEFDGEIEPLSDEERQPDPELVRNNIFANDGEGWDYQEEVAKRTPNEPYVLHRDEFFNDERDFVQSTFTYYVKDDQMADEDDTPVYNYHHIIGDLKFGHGSGDPNVFYVRNEKRRAEYEVVRTEDSFAEVVMGLDIENNERTQDLRHSNDPRKFKME